MAVKLHRQLEFIFRPFTTMATLDDIPNELIVRILTNVDDMKTLLCCERVCQRFADTIQNDHFKASWLIKKFGTRALGVGVANSLNTSLNTGYDKLLNEKVAMLLVANGSDVHAVKDLPLVWAASRGLDTLFARLLEEQAISEHQMPENWTPQFPWAVSILGSYTALYSMSPYPHEILGEASPPTRPLDFALHAACAAGKERIVRQILEQQYIPINLDSSQNFALRVSTAGAHTAVIDLLLAHGARSHHDTFTICLDKYEQYSNEGQVHRAQTYREIVAQLLNARGRFASHQHASQTLERIYRDFDSTWHNNMALIVAGDHCDQDDLAKLALEMLRDDDYPTCTLLLSNVCSPCDLICILLDIARSLELRGHPSTVPDILLVRAIRERNPELLHFLLLHDRTNQNLYSLPWCVSLAHSGRPTPESLQMLTLFNIKSSYGYSIVFRDPESLCLCLDTFLRACPTADRQRSLDAALYHYIRRDNVRAINWLMDLGADPESSEVQGLLNDQAELHRLQPETLAALVPRVSKLRPKLIALIARSSGVRLREIFESGGLNWERWGKETLKAVEKVGNGSAVKAIMCGKYVKTVDGETGKIEQGC